MEKYLAWLMLFGLAVQVIPSGGSLPDDPDGAVLHDTLDDGSEVVTGFSTNPLTSPDGKPYPRDAKLIIDDPMQPRGSDSHPDDGVPELSLAVRKKRGLPIGPYSCPYWFYWIRPWWVYWGRTWWPVLNSPWWGWHWHHWYYCLPYECKARIYDAGVYRYMCSRCKTEWGWIRVPIWYWGWPYWIWIRAPVGCCCDIQNLRWC
ncbi:uncharacterized protein LOC106177234 [Lingula anatina]|uniref:Uncharacterized protein LOC106177234 n=1 Tax=Lingula anatina TaxID=7574 RepID=A0A1S3JYC2_LINAN|nr:uncharacterized protein LOC106177234 [Lingula anatina]XP_013415411.1 uncharacterized protein LOC106177234 [Lingula anatina]|eukprot:XP_013415410.1 uncharacterized protein LOC106177234 [Lingula anatina]